MQTQAVARRTHAVHYALVVNGVVTEVVCYRHVRPSLITTTDLDAVTCKNCAALLFDDDPTIPGFWRTQPVPDGWPSAFVGNAS